MSEAPTLPSYAVLTDVIQTFQAHGHAAQMHGVICGYVCASTVEPESHWEEAFPGIQKNKKAYALLREVEENSQILLSDFSFDFVLILPDEETNINERAEALGLWCQGFLTGLELAHIPIQGRKPDQLTETIQDLLEIADISFGDIPDNEEDELAYFELVEYVRLSVLMVFHELGASEESETTKESEEELDHDHDDDDDDDEDEENQNKSSKLH